MSKKLDEFVRLLKNSQKAGIKPQLVWAKCTAVDWPNKKMTAKGLVDDLEYYEVLLGLGHIDKRPKINSNCLLGIIGNHDAFTFLVAAEEVEEMRIKSDTTDFTINEDGYQITRNGESLTSVLNDFMDEVMKIVVIQGRSIDVPAVTAIKQRLNTFLK